MLRRRRFGLRARYFAGAFCVAVCALAPPAALATATILGQVTSEGGGPLGVLVKVQVELPTGSLVKQVVAGPDGRFEFTGLDQTVYRVRAMAQGFEPEVREANFEGPINEIVLHIALSPIRQRKAAPPVARSDKQASRKARKEFARGRRALKEKKLDEARTHLENAVQDFPCYARAQTDLALIYVRDKNVSSAETALRKSISCDADYTEAYGWLAMVLNGTGRYTESKEVLGEGIRRAPDSWNFHYLLGEAFAGLNQFGKAKEQYLKVRSLNPNAPAELRARLADLFHKIGDYQDAYTEMQGYLRADPQGRFAGRFRALMEEMVSSGQVHPDATATASPPIAKN